MLLPLIPSLIFLPNPLSFGKTGGETILDYFAWGHRLRIYTQVGFCLFDGVLKEVPVLELNLRGALSAKGDELTAYDFEEANGFLKSHWGLFPSERFCIRAAVFRVSKTLSICKHMIWKIGIVLIE
ncbi:hypothetical protein CsSME_00019842 [Camellia sinensis var. sinensis]